MSGKAIHRNPSIQATLKLKCCNDIQLRKLNTFFDKGFQQAIDDRFQTVEELETRLHELLNPDTLTTSEDVTSTLIRSIKCTEMDKQTLLWHFKNSIYNQILDFEQALHNLPIPVLRKQVIPFVPGGLGLDMSLPMDRDKQFVLLTMDTAERVSKNISYEGVYFYELALHNRASKRTLLIEFEFQLVKSECVCYRTIRETDDNGHTVLGGPDVVERFSSPDDVSLVHLFNEIEAGVKICLELITE